MCGRPVEVSVRPKNQSIHWPVSVGKTVKGMYDCFVSRSIQLEHGPASRPTNQRVEASALGRGSIEIATRIHRNWSPRMRTVGAALKAVQYGLRSGCVDLENRAQIGCAPGIGCSIEISGVVTNEAGIWVCSVIWRPSEPVHDNFNSGRADPEHSSTAAGAVVVPAERGRAVKNAQGVAQKAGIRSCPIVRVRKEVMQRRRCSARKHRLHWRLSPDRRPRYSFHTDCRSSRCLARPRENSQQTDETETIS